MGNNIYIAGPMRGYPEFNFPAFFSVECRLQDAGWNVFNPARHDVDEYNLDTRGMKGDMHEIPQFNLRNALVWDTQRICESDAIFMLNGWEHSTGARAEHALALALGLKILYEYAIYP